MVIDYEKTKERVNYIYFVLNFMWAFLLIISDKIIKMYYNMERMVYFD
jgi:hypothetical protein